MYFVAFLKQICEKNSDLGQIPIRDIAWLIYVMHSQRWHKAATVKKFS